MPASLRNPWSMPDAHVLARLPAAVHLLVLPLLDMVFRAPQEPVGALQLGGHRRRDMAGLGQTREDGQQMRFAQAAIGATAQDLVRLNDEFDLADAAGSEFDITAGGGLAGLRLDPSLQLAQRFEHAVVQVSPVDKGPQQIRIEPHAGSIAGHRPRLDIGIALPCAAVL